MHNRLKEYFLRNKEFQKIWIFFSRRNIILYSLIVILSSILIGEVRFVSRINVYHLNQFKEGAFAINIKMNINEDLSVHDLKSGVAYYKKILEISGPVGSSYGNLGFCYYYLKDYNKAIEAYDRAIRLDPLRYVYWMDQGMIYFKLKNYKKAIIYLKKAVELIPQTSRYYVDMAKIYSALQWEGYIFDLMPDALNRSQSDIQLAYLALTQCYCNVDQIENARDAILAGLLVASKKKNHYYLKNFEYFLEYNGQKGILFSNLEPELHFDYDLNRIQIVTDVLGQAAIEERAQE